MKAFLLITGPVYFLIMDRSAIHRRAYAGIGGRQNRMQSRLELQKVAPEAFRAMLGFQSQVNHFGLEPTLVELVKIRASQVNGCAYCIDMHTKDARAHRESDNVHTHCLSGARLRSSPTGSGPPSNGPRH
jgi:AhpD family alkylhydroperoxidase